MTTDEAFAFFGRYGNVTNNVEQMKVEAPTSSELQTAIGVASRTTGNNKMAWEAGKLVAEFHKIELSCKHEEFDATVDVTRLKDSERFTSDIKINCRQCGVQMVFLGFPVGCHIEKPMTNVDRTELRAPIHPKGETLPPIPEGIPVGFTVHPPITGRISGKDVILTETELKVERDKLAIALSVISKAALGLSNLYWSPTGHRPLPESHPDMTQKAWKELREAFKTATIDGSHLALNVLHLAHQRAREAKESR